MYSVLDRTFSALSDPTRRHILERLAGGPATISELAQPFDITLPGLLKHVRILEEAGLVVTEKQGRTRQCRLGSEHLDDAAPEVVFEAFTDPDAQQELYADAPD